ncbi:hypothetical protein VSS74_15315 [Conexibacter stalactiti]|uniref:Uncharacterized protein n=1 Tax=Conexibacter stalactiti TaxID=1940611 RepID=A0ABU4HQW1_9ACTN|nr:hypothetical protein [Conexibacter stalactiti]MDW5595718.1 hypothetical protein [Conexibacter stalactiti]MEC5036360.1 hypothetical protein [Conexibacter stalactiti]
MSTPDGKAPVVGAGVVVAEPAPESRALAARERFLRAAPPLQRNGLRLLLALKRRPRGAQLLAHLPAADQVAHATLALLRYDDQRAADTLGWDPDAVVARGRALRERRA